MELPETVEEMFRQFSSDRGERLSMVETFFLKGETVESYLSVSGLSNDDNGDRRTEGVAYSYRCFWLKDGILEPETIFRQYVGKDEFYNNVLSAPILGENPCVVPSFAYREKNEMAVFTLVKPVETAVNMGFLEIKPLTDDGLNIPRKLKPLVEYGHLTDFRVLGQATFSTLKKDCLKLV